MTKLLSGSIKFELIRRLGPSWPKLADWLDIPFDAQKNFLPGDEARAILTWLEDRRLLDRLTPGLIAINRTDLARLLLEWDNEGTAKPRSIRDPRLRMLEERKDTADTCAETLEFKRELCKRDTTLNARILDEANKLFEGLFKADSDNKRIIPVWDAFFAYSVLDADYSARVAARLTQQGYKIFFARTTVEAGGVWLNEINGALKQSRHLLVLVTENYENSAFLKSEVVSGRNLLEDSKSSLEKIIPITIKRSNQPIPIELSTFQSITIPKNDAEISAELIGEHLPCVELHFRKQLEKFRDDVQISYESIGITLERCSRSPKNPFDFITKIRAHGIGEIRLGIRCEPINSKKISSWILRDATEKIGSLEQYTRFASAIIVHNTPEVSENSAYSESPAIQIVHVDSIIDDVFFSEDIRRELVNSYEISDIYESYIPLNATLDQTKIQNVEDFLFDWLKQPGGGFCTILADFGAGKTTLLQRLHYRISLSGLSDKTTRTSLFFYLRDFNRSGGIDSLIHQTIFRETRQHVSLDLFWREVDKGRFVVLLDGFDEMVSQSSVTTRFQHMLSIASFIRSSSRVILTCRPTYFVDRSEFNKALAALDIEANNAKTFDNVVTERADRPSGIKKRADVRSRNAKSLLETLLNQHAPRSKVSPIDNKAIVLELEDLDSELINDFLRSKNDDFMREQHASWHDVLVYLENVYDLKDLLRRPLLLQMIVDTLLSGKININSKTDRIGPAQLYTIYTETKFQRDWRKSDSRQLFSPIERRYISQLIALVMYTNDKYEADYQQLLEMVDSVEYDALIERLINTGFEAVFSDIRVCNFLKCNDNNAFQFTHKSFMEYFVASHFRDNLLQKNLVKQLLTPLPKQIRYFLGSFASDDATLWENARHYLLSKESLDAIETVEALKENMASILWCSGSGTTMRSFSANEATIALSDLIKSEAQHISLSDCRINVASVVHSTINGFKFDHVQVRDFLFTDCAVFSSTFDCVSLGKCEIGRLTFSKSSFKINGPANLIEITAIDSDLDIGVECDINTCKMTRSRLNLHGKAKDVNAINCQITTQSRSELCNSVLSGSKIQIKENSRLKKCALDGDCELAVLAAELVDCTINIWKLAELQNAVLTGTTLECDFVGTNIHMADGAIMKGRPSINRSRIENSSVSQCARLDLDQVLVENVFFENIEAVNLSGCKCNKNLYKKLNLEVVKNSEVTNSQFSLAEVKVLDSNIDTCDFEGSSVEFSRATIANCKKIFDCKITFNKTTDFNSKYEKTSLKLSSSNLKQIELQHCAIEFVEQENVLEEVKIENSIIDLSGRQNTCVKISKGTFSDCELRSESSKASLFEIKDTSFLRCAFSGVTLKEKDEKALYSRLSACTGFVIATFIEKHEPSLKLKNGVIMVTSDLLGNSSEVQKRVNNLVGVDKSKNQSKKGDVVRAFLAFIRWYNTIYDMSVILPSE